MKGFCCFQVEDAPEGAPTFDDSFMQELLQELSKIGDVILVRFVEDTLWVTFRDGQCALAAVSNGPMWVSTFLMYSTLSIQK